LRKGADGGEDFHRLAATVAQGGILQPRSSDQARPAGPTQAYELALVLLLDLDHVTWCLRLFTLADPAELAPYRGIVA